MSTIERRAFLKGLLATPLVLSGCAHAGAVSEAMTGLAVESGSMDADTAEAINQSAHAVARTFEDITPKQEYYIGRAVGAQLLTTHKPIEDEAATRYINLLGHTLAFASSRPETFGGYHFLLLDSDQINAFAAPGGLIFITRGLIACCETEDALAGVIAHEIAHVAHRHGLQAIENSRITEAVISVGSATATALDAGELNELTQVFGGSIDDITRTLVNSGYGREMETKADQSAVQTMSRVGYNPAGLVQALQRMNEKLRPGDTDFASTHPSPLDRIGDVSQVADLRSLVSPPARQARFERALASIA